jgi:hypothetical protein
MVKIKYICKKTGAVFAYKNTTKSVADKEINNPVLKECRLEIESVKE